MRVVIVEDSPFLRDGLTELLTRRGHEVLAALPDARKLPAELAILGPDRQPDVVVMDIRMPPTHTNEGLVAALRLRAENPQIAVLLFSQYVETKFAADLFAGDAKGVGYLLKDRVSNVASFMQALARVAAGETVLDPEVVTQLMNADRVESKYGLTNRETEVLKLIAEGRSNAAIAEQLYLSDKAVEKSVTAIFGKLALPPAPEDNRRVLAVLRFLGI